MVSTGRGVMCCFFLVTVTTLSVFDLACHFAKTLAYMFSVKDVVLSTVERLRVFWSEEASGIVRRKFAKCIVSLDTEKRRGYLPGNLNSRMVTKQVCGYSGTVGLCDGP